MGTCVSRSALVESPVYINTDDMNTTISTRIKPKGLCRDSLLTLESRTEQESSPGDSFRPEAPYRLTQKIVYDFIWQYMDDFTNVAQDPSAKAWAQFWDRNHAKDYVLVRPSGNPLDLKGLITMFETKDITDFSDSVVAVESLKILGDGTVATMIFKSEQIFNYKGSQEDDVATWTAVLVADQDLHQPKITNIHRSTGRRVGAVFTGNVNPSTLWQEKNSGD